MKTNDAAEATPTDPQGLWLRPGDSVVRDTGAGRDLLADERARAA